MATSFSLARWHAIHTKEKKITNLEHCHFEQRTMSTRCRKGERRIVFTDKEKRIMRQVKIVSLLVKDYDAAIAFYTQKLAFEVKEDKAFGDRRWVMLSLPNNGCSLALELAKTAEDLALVGKQAGSFPLLALDTADCVGDYKVLRSRGVTFHGEPASGPWGMRVLLEDLYGNKVFLSQEA